MLRDMPLNSVQRPVVLSLAVCAMLLMSTRGVAGDSWRDFTNNRTQWDDQIRDIRARRSSGSSSSEPYPGYARDRAAEIFRENHPNRVTQNWGSNAYRIRVSAERARAEAARVAAEEAARSRALEKLYAASNAGDANAMMEVAAREAQTSPAAAVGKYVRVQGPRREEALWAAVRLIRNCGLGTPGSELELRQRLALEELSLRGDVIATRERAMLSDLDVDVYVALQYSTKAALAGDEPSQRRVVRIFADGKVDGVPAPAEKVYAWCRAAGEAGDVGGQVMLGRALFWGNGIAQNLPEALVWFQKAIASDSKKRTFEEDALRLQAMNLAGTMLLMGNGVPEDKPEGFALLRKAAEGGNETAALNVANCYLSGDGVDKNPAEAVHWFERAAERGNAEAARTVADLYFSPDEACYDEAAGLRWTQRFSKRDPRAMITYAQFVRDGRYGLRPDPVKAKELFDGAFVKFPDDDYVLNAIGVMTLKGLNDFTPDAARGIALLKQAYEHGSAISARSLQKIYTKGLGVPADPVEAGRWQELAVAAGAPEIPME